MKISAKARGKGQRRGRLGTTSYLILILTNLYARSVPLLDSIVVSIPACHAGDRGSIPRRGAFSFSTVRFIIAVIS